MQYIVFVDDLLTERLRLRGVSWQLQSAHDYNAKLTCVSVYHDDS